MPGLLKTWLLAALLPMAAAAAQDSAADADAAWNPRSGDAWVDRQLGDMNRYGSRYPGAFGDEVVRYHAAPRALVDELLTQRGWKPGDVYYACLLAQTVGRPCRAVADAWAQHRMQNPAQGWAAVADQVGLDADDGTRARMRQAVVDSYQRWGRPLAVAPAPAKTGAGRSKRAATPKRR